MTMVAIPEIKIGDEIIEHGPKIYDDIKANPGEKALICMHTVPFEGSVGLINMLTATRLVRKGFDVTFLLYGPGVLMASNTRGFPKVGDEGFAGNGHQQTAQNYHGRRRKGRCLSFRHGRPVRHA